MIDKETIEEVEDIWAGELKERKEWCSDAETD